MLFLNDTISLQNSKIVSKIFSQHARNGITDYLNLFGDLYYGHLLPEIFLDRHKGLMKEFIKRLTSNGPDVAHNLCMIELAQRETWRWPAPLTQLSKELLWSAGNSRTVATGLVHDDPWAKLPVLILQRRGQDASTYLYDPMRITNDEQLHQALGLGYTVGDYCHPEVEVQATLAEDSGHPVLLLKYIGNKETEQDYSSIGQSKLQSFNGWMERYTSRPVLNVYTDYPENVTSSTWNTLYCGPIPNKEVIQKPGHLERAILMSNPTDAHALYITDNQRINVDLLLPWMDLEHNMYIDKKWSFALYRHSNEYKSKFISIPQDRNKY